MEETEVRDSSKVKDTWGSRRSRIEPVVVTDTGTGKGVTTLEQCKPFSRLSKGHRSHGFGPRNGGLGNSTVPSPEDDSLPRGLRSVRGPDHFTPRVSTTVPHLRRR